MLVITVKQGECFWVGDAKVLLIDVFKGRIRVGIDAPPETIVDREIIRERREAGITPKGKQ